jgi:hypothetical protein
MDELDLSPVRVSACHPAAAETPKCLHQFHCIVPTVLDKLGRESLIVSDRGLRHRLLVERFAS